MPPADSKLPLFRCALLSVGSLLLGVLTACSAARAPEPASIPAEPGRVWPSPPAEPRIQWIGQVSSPADLGVKVPLISRISNFLTGGDKGREALVRPFGLAVDEAGNLCVTDTGSGAVSFYDLAQHQYRRWTEVGGQRFDFPVAVAKRGGLIYVADSGRQEVIVFNGQGQVQRRIREEADRPSGLAVTGDRLYVACANTHVIRVYDLQGHALFQFGGRGVRPGEFNFPTHLAVDDQNRIYVTDAMNSRVQVFDAEGKFQREIGSLGDGSGHFSRPKGVALDRRGEVFVSDALFDNVQVFDGAGRFLMDFGSAGSQRGECWMPAGLAIAPGGRIYLADSYNGRVQIFQLLGTP